MTTKSWPERFEELWKNSDVPDALFEYAFSETYENPNGYPIEKFKEFVDFISSVRAEGYAEGFKQGKFDTEADKLTKEV